jgi:hypothetical protein
MKEELKDHLIMAQSELIAKTLNELIGISDYLKDHNATRGMDEINQLIYDTKVRKADITEKIDNFDHLTNEASKDMIEQFNNDYEEPATSVIIDEFYETSEDARL